MPPIPNPELRKLLAAQVPADFADWLDFVAIGALLAFSWGADPFVFALLAVSMGLPYLFVGPFAGVLVDRMDAKTVMIWANFGRGVVTASFFFAPNWQYLMALIATRSAVDTFFTPAKQAAIQALVAPERRAHANGLSHAINQASKIVAPAIGGGLLIWATPQSVFLLNAVVSFVAAGLLTRMASIRPTATHPDAAEPGMLESIRDGFKEVLTKTTLRVSLWMMAASYFAVFFYDTLVAPLTRDLGFTQTDLGLSLAAVGAGGVIGAVALSASKEFKYPFRWIAAGSLISGITIASLGGAEMIGQNMGITVFVSAFAILGLCSAMTVVPFRSIIQNSVSDKSIGRVTALSEAANTMALLTAPFIGAFVASVASIGAAFVCGGIIMVLVALRAAMLRNHR